MRPILAAVVLLSLCATVLGHPAAELDPTAAGHLALATPQTTTEATMPSAAPAVSGPRDVPADDPATATPRTVEAPAPPPAAPTLPPEDAAPHTVPRLRMDVAPAPRHVAGEEIQFVCPEGPMGLPFSPGGDPLDRTFYGCPLRVYDQGNPFGNSAITVHSDHREMAFCGLHGSPMRDGAHGYSRRGLTHTTFTSASQGTDWDDQPIEGPDGGAGETGSCVMDKDGRLYIAYTVSHVQEGTLASGEKAYNSTIGLYKAGTAGERRSVMDSYDRSFYVRSATADNPIEQAHLARVASVFIPENATAAKEQEEDDRFSGHNATGNQTGNQTGGYGDAAVPGEQTDETIVLVYHEGVYGNTSEGRNVVGGAVRLWWTDTQNNNTWQAARSGTEVGPCIDASEPAVVDQYVYVACSVGAGYEHRSRARIGQVDLWRFDVRTMEAEHVSYTGIMGLNPRLAANERGYMVLTTHRLIDDGTGAAEVEVRVATGWHGREFREIVGDWGAVLRQASGGRPILDADVTALSVSDDNPTGLLVFKEFHPPSDQDPVAMAAAGVQLSDYTKTIVAFNECDGPLAAAGIITGTSLDAYQAEAYAQNPEIYNDIHDGLFHTVSPDGRELWYFSINDYGAMQFGAVIVASASDPTCFILPPPPLVPPPPLQPLAFANPYTLPAGLAFGALSTAMVAYALAARRRSPHATAAEDN